MKKLFVTVCLALGVVACGPADSGAEEEVLESTEQEICPATCPAGTSFSHYTWVCTGQTTSTCRSGIEREYAVCYDSYNSNYVMGGTTCRSRCGCAIVEA